MGREERKKQLYEALIERSRLELSDAMTLLGVSESTARRLFDELEAEHRAIRVHGGIRLVRDFMSEYCFEWTAATAAREKESIARAACTLVEEGDVLYCDSGTTLHAFCRALASRIESENLHVSIFTNSLANLEALSPHTQVTLIGGRYRPNRQDFCGFLAENALSSLGYTRAFLGTDGVLPGQSFMTTDFETARLNQLAVEHAEETIVLCDAQKLRRRSMIAYASMDKVSRVVTDLFASDEEVTLLMRAGITVVRAVGN
ncbi:MAG: DeoR/GlpR family DNA-binding transcription regulator [Clostridiaceae bacterium]|nr:DeoR/GlpR family DNA-binding transcription regulator [Clostridiaceae bacterium]